jgi:hypothetical protein
MHMNARDRQLEHLCTMGMGKMIGARDILRVISWLKVW